MKNLTRLLCVLMALACVLCFAACNKDNGEDTAESTENNSGVKFYMEYKDVKIQLGADAKAVLEALGEPQKKTENGNCGGLGVQYKYSYSSIDLYVLEATDGSTVVDQITFRDDLVETAEGVSIGSSVSDAKAALGEPTSTTSSSLIYTKGKYNLKIGFEGETVNEINYLTVNE